MPWRHWCGNDRRKLFLMDEDNSVENKIDKQNVHVEQMKEEDVQQLRVILEDFHKETGSKRVCPPLTSFKMVVPN